MPRRFADDFKPAYDGVLRPQVGEIKVSDSIGAEAFHNSDKPELHY